METMSNRTSVHLHRMHRKDLEEVVVEEGSMEVHLLLMYRWADQLRRKDRCRDRTLLEVVHLGMQLVLELEERLETRWMQLIRHNVYVYLLRFKEIEIRCSFCMVRSIGYAYAGSRYGSRTDQHASAN